MLMLALKTLKEELISILVGYGLGKVDIRKILIWHVALLLGFPLI